MRASVVVFALCACSSSSKAPEPGSASGSAPPADAARRVDAPDDEPPPVDAAVPTAADVTIALRVAAGTQPVPADATLVALAPDGLRMVPANAPRTVDGGRLALKLPVGLPVTPEEIARGDGRVVVLADGATSARALDQLAFALRERCWSVAETDGKQLTAAWPEPCPDGSDIDLAIIAHHGYHDVSKGGQAKMAAGAELAKSLADHKASADFAKRTDLVFGAGDGATVADMLEVAAVARAAGFVAARWVPGVWAVTRPPAPPFVPPPPAVQLAIGPSTPANPDVDRIVLGRAGLFRVCYQKELKRTPGIAGTLVVALAIGSDGRVKSARASGTLADAAVKSCVEMVSSHLAFRAGAETRASVPLTFSTQ